MSTEIISPSKSNDGITFYISSDGERAGISIVGLERLIGLAESGNLFSRVKALKALLPDSQPQRETVNEWLKPAQGNVFEVNARGSDGARIITQEAAVAVITYYAIHMKNPVAMHSLAQFAKIGFNTWVKQVTNFAQDGKYDKLISLVQELMSDVKEMKVKVDRLDRLESTSVTIYPGLKQINDSLSAEETRKLLADQKLYTVKEWLALNKIELSKSDYHRFSLLVAETYRSLTHQEPTIKYIPYQCLNGRMSRRKEGNGYRLTDFYILEASYNKLRPDNFRQAS